MIAYRANVKRLHCDVTRGISRRIAGIRREGWRPADVVEEDRYGLARVVVWIVHTRPTTGHPTA